MTKFYKAEFSFSLVKEKYKNRINESLNNISMEELKNLTKWYIRKIEQAPKEKPNLISLYEQIRCYGNISLEKYLINNNKNPDLVDEYKPHLKG